MAEEPVNHKRPVLKIRTGPRKGEEQNLSSVAAEAVTPDAETSIREIVARIEDVFSAIGTKELPGTILPVGSKNNAAEAAEFVVAEKLAKLAKKRLEKASEAAEKAGVFGDPAAYVEGDTVMVYSDPNFTISMKMGNPSKTIKPDLVKKCAPVFLSKAKAEEFLEAVKGDRAATKQLIVSMK